MSAVLTLGSAELHDYPVRAIQGFHRPLNGEAANVTVLLDLILAERGDFLSPLLGTPATLILDGVTLLTGYVRTVTWTATDLTVTLEG